MPTRDVSIRSVFHCVFGLVLVVLAGCMADTQAPPGSNVPQASATASASAPACTFCPKTSADGCTLCVRQNPLLAVTSEGVASGSLRICNEAAVLGWSAAIDRIHRKIEGIGFQHFNVASAQMASQQAGRFKKFNQVQNVKTISDIRMVFDNIVLWVIEGMGLIDSNQHTRLTSCFDMRCQSAHPGDAPITAFNLLSFFSDLDQIVLNNPKFQI